MTNIQSEMMTPKLNLKITKMSGSGNDFILLDNRSGIVPDLQMPLIARSLCRRMVSVGADGMIFIVSSDRYDFKWRFFNADGSEAEMCGNGGRCAARFAFLQGIAGAAMTFETLAGPIPSWVEGTSVKLQLTKPQDLRTERRIEVSGKPLDLDFINTGVPHALIRVKDIETADMAGLGPQIRYHEYFQPAGANVNFVQLKNPGELLVRTYERGVEGETLACGTGSVAAAAMAFYKSEAVSPIKVHTRGGEVLTVYVEGIPDKTIEKVYLEGAVRLIFQGEVFEEALFE
ncbi:MAG: diaminopimelate epimerase [Thermodesulfobacteriota bacterium]